MVEDVVRTAGDIFAALPSNTFQRDEFIKNLTDPDDLRSVFETCKNRISSYNVWCTFIAQNENTPVDVMEGLIEVKEVSMLVLNPHVPAEVLLLMVKSTNNYDIFDLFKHQNITEEIFKIASVKYFRFDKASYAASKHASTKILQYLVNDGDKKVRELAFRALCRKSEYTDWPLEWMQAQFLTEKDAKNFV